MPVWVFSQYGRTDDTAKNMPKVRAGEGAEERLCKQLPCVGEWEIPI